ncbi:MULTISPECIES: ester cyclase [Nocardioides]|uniref:Ester cyclase n=1 Tax=Nocardioides vastitatis TaxID=2568655 RepID=A0ABW0ZPM9_9ACTN|nr:ester cyclase [Nocardioides sp.]THI93505.1 ester cyclase [Nocardioides sp.]
MPDDDARRKAIRAAWEAAWDRGEVGALDDLLSPSYRRLTRHDEEGQDLTAFKASVIATRAAFPDLVTTIDDIVVDGDRAAVRWHSVGTHQHGFLGVPPTRKEVEVTGATFARFEGDRIVEEFVTWDPRALLAALGIISVGQDQ